MYYQSNHFLCRFPDTYIERGVEGKVDGKRRVALTFDDGPGTQTVPLLALLDKFSVKASFFLLAQNIATQRRLVKQMMATNHSVGMHGFSHVSVLDHSAEQFVSQQLLPSQQYFARHFQYVPRWYRPPFGEINPEVMTQLQRQNIKVVGWSVDPRDWSNSAKGDHVETVVTRVMEKVHDGAIVLLHDGDDSCFGPVKVVEIMTLLVPKLLAANFELVNIEQIVAHGVGQPVLV